ncbi:MAG: hypothetical protein AAFV19_17695 [Pseudomonadota bacterium]
MPTLFIVCLAIAVGACWLLVLLILAVLLFGSGGGTAFGDILPTGLDGSMQIAVYVQYAFVLATILAILGFGTATLIFVANGALTTASSIAQVLVRIMIAMTAVGWLAQAATPLAVSGSVLTAIPILLTGLPATAAQLAFLVLADHFLRPQESDIF